MKAAWRKNRQALRLLVVERGDLCLRTCASSVGKREDHDGLVVNIPKLHGHNTFLDLAKRDDHHNTQSVKHEGDGGSSRRNA